MRQGEIVWHGTEADAFIYRPVRLSKERKLKVNNPHFPEDGTSPPAQCLSVR